MSRFTANLSLCSQDGKRRQPERAQTGQPERQTEPEQPDRERQTETDREDSQTEDGRPPGLGRPALAGWVFIGKEGGRKGSDLGSCNLPTICGAASGAKRREQVAGGPSESRTGIH